MAVSHLDHGTAQLRQVLVHFLDVVADLGADLDLRTQQLGRYLLAAFFLGLGHQCLWRVDNQCPGFLVDQQVFFFYANCK